MCEYCTCTCVCNQAIIILLGKAAGFAQKIHPSILKKIGEYVLAGVTDVTEIRRLLRLYVRENVSKDLGETPHPLIDHFIHKTVT